MAKQICERFAQEIMGCQLPVERQIQDYLERNPNYRVSACSYAISGIAREALVVFYDPETGSIAKAKQK